MIDILLQTLPFFALIGLGWAAGQHGLFPASASDGLSRFVLYFALSALLVRLTAQMPIGELFDPWVMLAYLTGCLMVHALVLVSSRSRGAPLDEAAMEAHVAIVGNTGFLGVPLLIGVLGDQVAGTVLLLLLIDMILFNIILTLLITRARGARLDPASLGRMARELGRNPIIVSSCLGVGWSLSGLGMAAPVDDFLALLGSAATPGALFLIGASLAGRALDRVAVAGWLSLAKLVLHPMAMALSVFVLFPIDPAVAAVMVATSALPVAGNTYILARHYAVAPRRVSTAILISTAASIVTLTGVITWATGY